MPKMASESISGILDKDLAIENGPVPAELFQVLRARQHGWEDWDCVF